MADSPPGWCAASTCAYDPDGQLVRDVDPNGFETLREYDGFGNLLFVSGQGVQIVDFLDVK